MFFHFNYVIDVGGATLSQCDATWTFSDPKTTTNPLEDNHVTWLDLTEIELTLDLHWT